MPLMTKKAKEDMRGILIILIPLTLLVGFMEYRDFVSGKLEDPYERFKAFLYMAMGIGLPASIASMVAGSALVVLSFIFKSWARAIVSGAIACSGGYIWWYLLHVDYPA